MTPAEAIAVLERRALDAAFVKERGDSELEEVIRALVGNAGGFAELSDLRDAVRAELIAAGWRYDWEGNGSFLPDDEIVPALRDALVQRAEAMEIAGRIADAVERTGLPIETDHTSLAEELIAIGAVPVVSRCLECGDDLEARVDEDGCCTTCGGDFVVCLHGLDSVEALNRWREYLEEGHRERVAALKGRLADVEEALRTTTAERDAARAALAAGSDTRAHGIIAAALSALTDRPQMMEAAPEDLPKLVERLRVALEREREAASKLRSQYADVEAEVRTCVPGSREPLIPLVRRLAEERDAARATAERERQRALLAEQLASHERGSSIPPRPWWSWGRR